jgi:hypothetical protein
LLGEPRMEADAGRPGRLGALGFIEATLVVAGSASLTLPGGERDGD